MEDDSSYTKEEMIVRCPLCRGKKNITYHDLFSGTGTPHKEQCKLCKGEGVVKETFMAS